MAPKADPKAKAKAEAKAEAKKKKDAAAAEAEEEEKNKVAQPDRTKFEEDVGKVNTEVEKLQKQLAALNGKIDERSTGKDEFFAQKNKISEKMRGFQKQVDEYMAAKDELAKKLGESAQKGKEMRTELNNMKKKLGYASEEEIEQKIANLEFQMWTSSLSLKEEKKMLEQIKELKRSKPKLKQYANMEEQVKSGTMEASALPLKEQMNALSEKIREARDEKRQQGEQYGKLMELRKKQMEDMPELFEKRNELNKQIGEKVKARNEIRDAYRSEERAYNAYLAEQRAIRAERAKVEREKRQAEWEVRKKERDEEKAQEQPHLAEITLLEQTISWCKAQLPKEDAKEKKEEKDTAYNNPEGAKILKRKDEREEEFFFAPTKVKGLKQGSKKKASTAIKHNVETFKLFDSLKLDAPITQEEVPPVIAKLEAQLADYNAKVEAWKKDRDEKAKRKAAGIEDPPAAAEEAAPAAEEAKEE